MKIYNYNYIGIYNYKYKCESISCSVMSNSLQPHGLSTARLLCPWNFPTRILEWVTFSFSRLSSQPKDRTRVSCMAGRFFYPLSHQRSQKNIIISVQFSCSALSNSLRPHGLQHPMPPCPSLTPRVHPNSCPLVGDAFQSSHPLSSPSPPWGRKELDAN